MKHTIETKTESEDDIRKKLLEQKLPDILRDAASYTEFTKKGIYEQAAKLFSDRAEREDLLPVLPGAVLWMPGAKKPLRLSVSSISLEIGGGAICANLFARREDTDGISFGMAALDILLFRDKDAALLRMR